MRTSALLFGLMLSLWACTPPASDAYEAGSEAMAVAAVVDMTPENSPEMFLWERLHQSFPALDQQLPGQTSFTGEYEVREYEKDGYVFSVELEQRGDSLIGSYCGGNNIRSDCGMPSQGSGECEIVGLVRNGKGYVTFLSLYAAGLGVAILEPIGAHMIWQTTEYPPHEHDDMYYCAAPEDLLIPNKAVQTNYTAPLSLPAYEAHTTGFLDELVPADSHYTFCHTRILSQPETGDVLTWLPAAHPVKVEQAVGSYSYAQYGDEIFEAPIYEISFQQKGTTQTGYILHEDLAFFSFRDDRRNLWLFGAEVADKNDDADLYWRVFGEAFGRIELPVGIPALKQGTAAYFPVYTAQVKTRSDLALGSHSFVEFTLQDTHNSSLRYHTLLSWDGETLAQIRPVAQGLIPQQLTAQRRTDTLDLSFSLPQLADDAARLRVMYQLDQDSLQRFAKQPITGLDLIFAETHDRESFPDEWDEMEWTGVYQADSLLDTQRLSLKVQRQEILDESDGTRMLWKEVGAPGDQAHSFYWKGAEFKPGLAGAFSRNTLGANETGQLEFPGSDWKLTSIGREADHSYLEMTLLLIGSRDGQKVAQELCFDKFREEPFRLMWCGDLDGDGQPDMVLELATKGFYTDARLFLSSQAAPGQLVGAAGYFRSPAPGA